MMSTWIMDFLLMLQAYGTEMTPGSQASFFDFNGNGIIDVMDILEMLWNEPPGPPKTKLP